jgi:hypothetical protein
MHQGENGLHGPCAGRLLLAGTVLQVMPDRDEMTPAERTLIECSAQGLQEKINQWWLNGN